MALTFLSYAMLDDREKTNCMDEAIIDYCYRYNLIDKFLPVAEATIVHFKSFVAYESVIIVKSENSTEVINYISEEA